MDNKESFYKLSSLDSEKKITIFIDEDTISVEDFEEGDLFDEYENERL